MKDDIIVGVRTSSRQHKILYLGFDVGRPIPVKVKLQVVQHTFNNCPKILKLGKHNLQLIFYD
jgi:hypothetical protein